MFFDVCVFFFKQKTAYEMRISDWSSDVCSSDLSRSLCTSCRRYTGIGRLQNAWSKPTSPCTPTWYADTRRSKKLASSCTSCSSMNGNGLRALKCLGMPSCAMRWSAQYSRYSRMSLIDSPATPPDRVSCANATSHRSEEHTSELQSLMRISYAVFC